ncbi:hypothetical protein BX666DRAFT_2004087 [Dichotomocladium elegans]|nr:hypothetical protein BX666DRAFT_2004087 [Dichotomocladium elegans]
MQVCYPPLSLSRTVTNATTVTSIVLRSGVSTNLNTVATISNAQLDATVGKYDWAIDSSIPTGSDYSVQVTTEQGQAYSPYFTILNSGSASAPPGSVAAGPSAAAASSGSGSAAKPSGSSSGSAPAPSSTTSGASAVKASAALGLAAGAVAVALF